MKAMRLMGRERWVRASPDKLTRKLAMLNDRCHTLPPLWLMRVHRLRKGRNEQRTTQP